MSGIDERIASQLSKLPSLVNAQEALTRRGRYLFTTFLVAADDLSTYVTIRDGCVEDVAFGPFLLRPWCFAVRATSEAWHRHWQEKPEPGYHDLFAMAKAGEARVEGDLVPFMANLQYLKDVLAAPRGIEAGEVAS